MGTKERLGFRMRWLIVCYGLVVLSGCNQLLGPIDPNYSADTDPFVQTVEGIGTTGAATGTPVGQLVFLGTTLLSTAWGTWQTNRAKQAKARGEAERTAKQKELDELHDVASSVVRVIDEIAAVQVGENKTVGEEVRSRVKSELKKRQLYAKGKAIIDGLKDGQAG